MFNPFSLAYVFVMSLSMGLGWGVFIYLMAPIIGYDSSYGLSAGCLLFGFTFAYMFDVIWVRR